MLPILGAIAKPLLGGLLGGGGGLGGIFGKLFGGLMGGGGGGGLGGLLGGLFKGMNPLSMLGNLDPTGILKGLTGAAGARGL